MMESVLKIFSETSSNIFYHQSCEFSFSREPSKASLDASTPNFQESSPQSASRKLVELVYNFLRVWLFFFFSSSFIVSFFTVYAGRILRFTDVCGGVVVTAASDEFVRRR